MFQVGKKVICVKTHSQGAVKKGQVFELLGIKKSNCKCGDLVLDVGLKSICYTQRCLTCNEVWTAPDIWWIGEDKFAPYDDSLSEITVDELLYNLTEQK